MATIRQVVAHGVNLRVLVVDDLVHQVVDKAVTADVGRREHHSSHVHSIGVVRNHLLHENCDRIAVDVVALHSHLSLHFAVDSVHALLKVGGRARGGAEKLRPSTLSRFLLVRACLVCTTHGVECIGCVGSIFVQLCAVRSVSSALV